MKKNVNYIILDNIVFIGPITCLGCRSAAQLTLTPTVSTSGNHGVGLWLKWNSSLSIFWFYLPVSSFIFPYSFVLVCSLYDWFGKLIFSMLYEIYIRKWLWPVNVRWSLILVLEMMFMSIHIFFSLAILIKVTAWILLRWWFCQKTVSLFTPLIFIHIMFYCNVIL